jgi:hypothetical protein
MVYLRQKINPVNEMGSKCTVHIAMAVSRQNSPVVCIVQESSCAWTRRIQIVSPVSWCISLHSPSCVTDEINILYMYLQYERLLVLSLSNIVRHLISLLSVYVKSACFEVHFRPLRWLA